MWSKDILKRMGKRKPVKKNGMLPDRESQEWIATLKTNDLEYYETP